MVEQVTGKVNYASWRNKHTGWHDSWAMGIDGEKTAEKMDWHDSYNLLIRGKKASSTPDSRKETFSTTFF